MGGRGSPESGEIGEGDSSEGGEDESRLVDIDPVVDPQVLDGGDEAKCRRTGRPMVSSLSANRDSGGDRLELCDPLSFPSTRE